MTSQLNIFLVNGLFIFLAVYVFLWKKRRHGKLLRDNERRLLEMAGKIRLIIDSVPVCIAYVDAEQRYRFVNRNYARLFGREPQEMAGGSIEEMLGDKFHTKIEDSIQQVLAGKEITLLNQMIAGKGAIHLQTRYLPHINEQGSVIGFFVQHYDITELSLTEEALRVSEKRYRAVFETSGSAMIIIEADTTISLANEEYVKMCGYSKEEIEGKMSWVDCVASVDRDRMLRYHRQLRIDPALAPANYEFRFVDRAGTVRDIMTTVAIIPGTERSVQSCLDITGLKQTERLLAGEKAALELIVRDTPLVDVLNLLCKNIEEQAFGALCSILLLDDSGSLLCHAAAPSLPEEYNKVIEGTRIGMNVGSCGTAAFTGQEVVVSDIATDQRWAKYWKLPLSYGLRACWSKPILSTSGAVLGTFAVYYNRVRTPDPAERLLMERAVHMASIVIGRKRAAEKLRQVQLHQRAILDNIPDLVWLKDRDSRFITVNKAFASASGMSPEELCGKTDLDIWPVDLAEKYRHDDRYVMDSGSQNRIEEEIAWMDGRRKWSETIKMPVYDENGGLIGTTGVARDIHERKRAEEELRESEERFHNIFDQSGDAIILFRLDTFVIIDANPAALELFGYSRTELLDQLPYGLIVREDFEQLIMEIGNNDAADMFQLDRAHGIRRDAMQLSIVIRARILRLRDEYVVHCSIRDISEKLRLEDEIRATQAKLIQTNKMTSLGMLSSSVAHEINNPNNCISVNASMLNEVWQDTYKILNRFHEVNGEFNLRGVPYSKMQEMVPRLFNGIIESSGRITAIVDNMKDFVRDDKLGLHSELDLNKLIHNAASILWHHIHRYTDNFQMTLQEVLLPARGNGQQIEQVIINLLMNALQALPGKHAGIHVTTSCDQAAGNLVISVRDEGIGMDRATMARLREPFFTTKLAEGGTGLGLYISDSILREHRGTIRFESCPGHGTTATVTLPIAD